MSYKQMKKCTESTRDTEGAFQVNIGEKRKLHRLHENEYLSNVGLPAALRIPDSSQYDESNEDGNTNTVTRDIERDDRSEGFGSMDGFSSIVATVRLVSMDSSSSSVRRKISSTAAKTSPPAAELEEFLAEAEKYVQERFAEKYNYDIVKDVPLEGRYQWVEL